MHYCEGTQRDVVLEAWFFWQGGHTTSPPQLLLVSLVLGSRQVCFTCGFSELKNRAGWLYFASVKAGAPESAGAERPLVLGGSPPVAGSSGSHGDATAGLGGNWAPLVAAPTAEDKAAQLTAGISAGSRHWSPISQSDIKLEFVAIQGVNKALYQLQTVDLFWGGQLCLPPQPLSSWAAWFLLRSASFHIIWSNARTRMESGFPLLYILCACLHQHRVDEECSALSFNSI